jgi:purine-binding chemotaxis protein CheW
MEETLKTNVADEVRQLVALHLGTEIYGVEIAYVHTVLVPQAITSMPQTPGYFKGVMNLRGQILPVIDLRLRFDLEAPEHSQTRIVIVNYEGTSAGLVVDAVTEVLRLPESKIEPPSTLIMSVATDCINGIGRAGSGKDERLILLLDIGKLLSSSLASVDLAVA